MIKKILEKFDIGITSYQSLQNLRIGKREIDALMKISNERLNERLEKLLFHIRNSKSQLRQDFFVLLELDFKKNGFFVEFGATNGISLSNTYLLEKEFGWNGILAEPAKCWHDDLRKNRDCHIETNCVWQTSNASLVFYEASDEVLSTISDFKVPEHNKKEGKNGRTYNVDSISLIDLLNKYNAPKTIDYLSLDTEGSEYTILSNFDFSCYKFNVITCEHNFGKQREKIFNLLTKNGYERKYIAFSGVDDWYVRVD